MTKLNKTLLTAAVVSALALPSIVSAATLTYPAGKQIHFAKDLIVNDGTTIETNNELQLKATAADAVRVATVAGDDVTVKVTLTNGAKFDSTADAATLVDGFFQGVEAGGAPAALAGSVVGTPYYSASGQELNFTFTAAGAGVDSAVAADYFLELNSLQVTNLVGGLFTGNSIGAEITVQNNSGVQILASSATIARSVWGLEVSSLVGDTTKKIDVGSDPRKTLFSPSGAVGGSSAPGNTYFNAGGVQLEVTQADLIGGGTGFVNNYNAIAANPVYNVVATADVTVTVTGTNLAGFTGGGVWLDALNTCSSAPAGRINGSVAGGVATFTSSVTNAIWSPVTQVVPGAAVAYVCFAADNVKELVPQALGATLSVNYKLPTQRVNPPPYSFDILPLALNGSTIIFQNVNPGGNATAQSFLRLTNNNAINCPVFIDAKDDAGLHSRTLSLDLAAHTSKQVNSDVLEAAFGDGTGKWYVRITAECSNFKASALNRHQDGVVTDLTPEKGVGAEWLTPPVMLP